VPSLINIENPEGEGEIEQSMSPTYPTGIFYFKLFSTLASITIRRQYVSEDWQYNSYFQLTVKMLFTTQINFNYYRK
jgi:hypothetical protein